MSNANETSWNGAKPARRKALGLVADPDTKTEPAIVVEPEPQVIVPEVKMSLAESLKAAEAELAPPIQALPVAVTPVIKEEVVSTWQPAIEPTAAPRTVTVKAPAKAPVSEQAESSKMRFSTYLPVDTITRAKAVFLATRDEYDNDTLAAFVNEALMAECAKRERKSNGGARFTGGKKTLPPGRPLR